MDAQYVGAYRELYQRHWWWRARETLLTREIARIASHRPPERILDVGCGDGLFFPVLQRYGDPWGVEPAEDALTPDGPWRPRIHAGPLDASFQAPVPFGLVLALDVVEHLADPDAFLEQARRVVAPDGWFVATVPAFRALWTGHDDLNAHVTRFRRLEFVALVEAHGFEVVHARYFFVLPAIAKLVTAFLERLLPRRPRPPRIPPVPLNALLQAICRLEQAVLGRRHPWFGSSLLVTARATMRPVVASSNPRHVQAEVQ